MYKQYVCIEIITMKSLTARGDNHTKNTSKHNYFPLKHVIIYCDVEIVTQ